MEHAGLQEPPLTLILASSSPRRRELLTHLGVPFEVVVSGVDEEAAMAARPETLARRLAAAKALAVAAQRPDATVLGADTIVVLRGEVLNKPADADEARSMLARLRDRRHRVVTAVALVGPGRRRARVEHTVTRVLMRPYTEAEVEAWIASGGPFDKAGAYGVQDPVFQPVSAHEGCYCNVMGLPLWPVAGLLADAGIAPQTHRLPERCRTCPARLEYRRY